MHRLKTMGSISFHFLLAKVGMDGRVVSFSSQIFGHGILDVFRKKIDTIQRTIIWKTTLSITATRLKSGLTQARSRLSFCNPHKRTT
jgi:hypothetical protein